VTTKGSRKAKVTESLSRYKPDWAKAQARWDAFWAMDATDRPCISVTAPRPNPRSVTVPATGSVEDKWLDPEYILATALKRMEETCLGGETAPASGHFMAGTTTGCNGNLCFHEGGISLRPSMTSMDEPLGWHPGPDDPWRARVDAICNRLLDEAPGRFIVSCPGQFEHVDLLNHTCGYKQHLELCLSRSYMRVIQYSHNCKESKNEAEHLEFYRRVQKAGRCLDLPVAPDQLEFVLRHLRPEGLHISTSAKSVGEADELLNRAARWAGTHANRQE
jgi:hypothetical protein